MAFLDGDKVTVGYRYYMGVHMITCLPVEQVREIWVGEKKVWGVGMYEVLGAVKNAAISSGELVTAVEENKTIFIWQEKAFGGEKQEGGISGYVDLEFGRDDQPRNTYLSGGVSIVAVYFTGLGNPSGILTETFYASAFYHDGRQVFTDLDQIYATWWDADAGYYRITAFANVGNTNMANTYAYGTDFNDSFWSLGGAGSLITVVASAVEEGVSNFGGIASDEELIPAYRGLMGFVLRRVYLGTSPYPKPWSFVVRRTAKDVKGDAIWYSAKADISGDMNPAHIIYEILTSKDFGLGVSTVRVDDTSFQSAADTLYTEGFGLSFKFDNPDKASEFIDDILEYIDGFLRINHNTGKFELVLARDDYTVGSLDTVDDSLISEMVEFSRSTINGSVNQISLDYTSEDTWDVATVTVHDPAKVAIQGSLVSNTLSMPGIHKSALAHKVATRELRKRSNPLFGCVIEGSPELRSYNIGDVFKISWPALGITGAVVRVVGIDTGSSETSKVRITLTEDIYGTADAVYGTPTGGWELPDYDPSEVDEYMLIELPYWHYARDVVGREQAAASSATTGMVQAACIKPDGPTFRYDLMTKISTLSDYTKQVDNAPFCGYGYLDEAMDNADDQVEVLCRFGGGLDNEIGKYVVIDDEYLLIVDMDQETRKVTFERGLLDTVPAAHAKNALIVAAETNGALDPNEYETGVTIDCKFRTETTGDIIDMDTISSHGITMDNRIIRPYPPGKVEFYKATDLTLSWAHRDRTLQTDYMVLQSASDIGPEAGTTYTVNLYKGASLRDTQTGLSGTSVTWTDEEVLKDLGLYNIDYSGTASGSMSVEATKTDGYYSWADGADSLVYNSSLARFELTVGGTLYLLAGTTVIGTYTEDGGSNEIDVARGDLDEDISIELNAQRDGYDSWQTQTRYLYA